MIFYFIETFQFCRARIVIVTGKIFISCVTTIKDKNNSLYLMFIYGSGPYKILIFQVVHI